jgi:hypothetical protein
MFNTETKETGGKEWIGHSVVCAKFCRRSWFTKFLIYPHSSPTRVHIHLKVLFIFL